MTHATLTAAAVPLRRRLDLQVVEQRFGGRRYWVLKDPVALRYAQLTEQEYSIWLQLDGQTAMDEIREAFERRFAPSKLRLPQLHAFLADLHQKGLVLSEAAGQGDQLRMRDDRRRLERQLQAWSGVLSWRFRGVDPQPLLDWLYPLAKPLFGRTSLLLSGLLAVAAIVLVAVQFEALRARLPEFESLLQATNLAVMALVLAGTKILHELGHALACKHFGRRCHELGVMLLVFVPCLYCNVSDAWTLPNKWHRIAVSAAGVWVELTLASICTFLWWFSEPGLFNSVCLNVMLVCSLNSLLFNGNPLLRYDGYYVLADWLELPNLWQQSRGYLESLLRRFVLGLDHHQDLAWRGERRSVLAAYGIVSILYRWSVLVAILLFLFRLFEPLRLQAAAQILTLIVIGGAVAAPLRQAWQMISNPANRVGKRGLRAALGAGLVLLAAAAAVAIPLPFHLTAPAVLEPAGARHVYVAVRGELAELRVQAAERVPAGRVLARLSNPQLELEVLQLRGELRQQQTRLENLQARRATDPDAALQIPAVVEALDDLRQRMEKRQEEQDKLILRASESGTVIPPAPVPDTPPANGLLRTWSGTPLETRNLGCTLEPGTVFCLIGDPERLEAILYLDQPAMEFVELGQPVRLSIDTLPGRVLRGEIVELAQHDAKVAPRELTPQDLPMQAGADGVLRPLQAPFQARVRLQDHGFQPPVGSRGVGKVQARSLSLGGRLLRLVRQTFRFEL